MAKKRKSASVAVAETPQEPEPVQTDQEPEYPQPEEPQQVPEEDQGVGDEAVGDGGEEEEEEEDEQEEEEDDEDPDNVDEQTDAVQGDTVKNDQQVESAVNPPPTSVPANGSEDEGDDEEEPLEKILEPFSKDQLTLLVKEAVAKHPDLVEIVHNLADSDPSHRKIFVHGLGWEASDESITTSFSKYGEVQDCKVVKDKISGKSKGYAFILFKHRKGARKALKEPQKLIEGRMASCQLASAGPVKAPTAPMAAAVPAPYESEYTRRKIYVSNVSPEIDPNKLSEFFSTFGEIEEGPLGLDKQTGKPRGFCLFVYKSLESAKKALEEPQKTFQGHTLHCQKAVDGPKHAKGFFSPQQSQTPRQHQGNYRHTAKKGRYSSAGGHLMAPNTGQVGYNPAVAPAAIGQAVAALLATQGAGLGIGNLLGGIGAGGNLQGGPPIMNNTGYGGQGGGGYVGKQGMQGGYGVRPHQGGAPYMGPGGH
ncbi:RNA-binding (RRM/RBD/RNP motifs) family protein [Striga asiatica]|uniref:RNA-binding (RRM/RBD/RNP motifs) family protein n=1 Tax=Striga asiatica TaxID=4170 RepID=A0A5A7Q2J5_STRAF|nr:RNA-binding (RRM/RBD/RNP motifs) family protein [Striga asiatica]